MLTNPDESDRITKLSARAGHTKPSQKFFKKKLKKVLTRGNECDIIAKLSARAGSERTLKIEQRKTRKQSELGACRKIGIKCRVTRKFQEYTLIILQ